jgi:DNA polymerase
MDQTTKQWKTIETYGGKIVENTVQAIARDCLADAIERLEAAGYPIVMHVHDEIVIDCPKDLAALDKVVRIMAMPVTWAPGLPMGADGWVSPFYKKE